MKKLLVLLLTLCLISPALAADKKDPLAAWKPSFDPSGAEYTYILACASHPIVEGIGVGYEIRDALWEKSNGRIYVDFRPLAQLGGEMDAINKVKMGAIQGALTSTHIMANMVDRLGVVNLPFVVNSYEKLEQFRTDPDLWGPYVASAEKTGMMVTDITGFGIYGFATTMPVKNLDDAKQANFRIAEAPLTADIFKAMGFKFTVMPFPEITQALQTGVINGLDHTAIIMKITKSFNIAKYFYDMNYTQGLFLHMVNKRWFNKLPPDLQKVFLEVVAEQSAKTRMDTIAQHNKLVAAAKADGVEFTTPAAEDKAELKRRVEPVLQEWSQKVGADYLEKVRTTLAD